jgi:hypothetical protein
MTWSFLFRHCGYLVPGPEFAGKKFFRETLHAATFNLIWSYHCNTKLQ